MKDNDYVATPFAGTKAGLQEAVDYVQSVGGKVHIGPGTLSITDDIAITGNKVTIEGSGDQTILSNDHTTGTNIFSVTGDNVTICDLRIEGNNGTKTFGRGVDTEGDDTTVYNVTFNATCDAAVASLSNARLTVHDCRMLSPGDAGSSDGYGVLLSTSTDAKVYGNYISAPRLSGIFCFGTSDRAVIEYNTVVNGIDNGIRAASTNTSCRIAHNYISGCGVDGIRPDATDCTVIGNQCISNSNAGIRTDGTSGGVWSGNLCRGNANSGLHVSNAVGDTTRLSIVGNNSHNNTGAGITLNPSTTRAHTNIVITENILTGNSFEGIRVIGASFACTAYIDGNYSSGNTTSDTENLSTTNWTYQARDRQQGNITSANTISVTGDGTYLVTGTTQINSITAAPVGTVIRLKFQSAQLTVQDGSNLVLESSFISNADSILTLVSDGTNWVEIGRSHIGSASTVTLTGFSLGRVNTASRMYFPTDALTADRYFKFPDSSGIALTDTSTATVTNKILDTSNKIQVDGSATRTVFADSSGNSRIAPSVAAVTAERVVSWPNFAGRYALEGAAVTFADADTTPTVAGSRLFKSANTGATSITTFDDGVAGQRIDIIFGDANTTLVDGATLVLRTGGNYTPAATDTWTGVFDGSVWYELTRSDNT